jgi:general secretion pathway protein G
MINMRTNKKGFTLIELLVVILILAILAALIVPRVIGRTGDAKTAKAKSDIATLSGLVQQFHLDVGRFPSNEEGLDALRMQPSDAPGWKRLLDKEVPADPWLRPYVYEYPGLDGDDSFLIYTYGADGAPGGEGENADISNAD